MGSIEFTESKNGLIEKWLFTVLGSNFILITFSSNIETDVGIALHSITPLVRISAPPENAILPSARDMEVTFLSFCEKFRAAISTVAGFGLIIAVLLGNNVMSGSSDLNSIKWSCISVPIGVTIVMFDLKYSTFPFTTSILHVPLSILS